MTRFKNKLVALAILFPSISCAGELTFSFKNPTFSGIGWSAQVLTVENEEYTRKQSVLQEQKAAASAALAAAQAAL